MQQARRTGCRIHQTALFQAKNADGREIHSGEYPDIILTSKK
jgi:hypothetical protein